MSPPNWPVGELVEAAKRGDVTSIEALVATSHPHVQRFAHSLCSTPEDAEEAAQEALIVLFRRIGTLRATAAFPHGCSALFAPNVSVARERHSTSFARETSRTR